MPPALPDFIPPMLARQGQPFDSEEHLFEIKWDGTRAQARIEGGQARLTNRRRRDLTGRYPELGFLGGFGDGLLLDGEIVVLHDGKPDFGRLMSREQARSNLKIAGLAKSMPVTYIAFDLLYQDGESVMRQPLRERRDRLRQAATSWENPACVVSSGIVGGGVDYFQAAVDQELEGVIAKRLDDPYEPGKRSGSWLKIKRTQVIQCAILGFVTNGGALRSLIIAAEVSGQLRCVGKVGSGISTAMGERLMQLLGPRLRPDPWLECEIDGQWVEPGLYCVVGYLELTRAGHLRAPVFRDLVVDE